MIQKQQHLLNLKNLEEKTIDEKNRLKKVYTDIKKDWENQNEKFEKTISDWKQNRENKLKQEEESILYEHNQKFQEIKDKHIESLDIITKDFETRERLKYKDISIQRKELNDNAKIYNEAKEYIENFDTLVTEKVSKQSGMKLGFLKKEHENSIKIETNNFINELDILELDLENKTHSCEGKNSLIEELKEKLTNAKSELNNLTQNTLTV